MSNSYQGIGLMSGTSMDGLDIACCTFIEEGDSYSFSLDAVRQVDFGETWTSRLLCLMDQSAEVYAKTNVYFGHWMGEQIRDFIKDFKLKPDFVATHGQTIFHQPHKNFTAQIGDGESIVSYLPCPLVSNFRNKDVALGGEGAPLIPLVEKYLFPQYKLFLNLGGFSNMTFGKLAFDVSPCNIVLNHLYREYAPEAETDYDPEGETARSGQLIPDLLAQLNAHAYFAQEAPKSLGWEWVLGEVMPVLATREEPKADLMHTYALHAAQQIAKAVEALGAKDEKILITGGGRHNTFLMELIESELKRHQIEVDASISTEIIDYKEAIGFAFLGLRTLRAKPTVMASVTGAKIEASCGSIHLPPSGARAFL